MGLLDFLNTGDPQKDAAISRGLLQAGLQLMQTKGKLLPGLSQGGLAGLQGFDQAQQQQYQQKFQKAQLEALERKKVLEAREDTLANLPSEFIKPASQGNNPSAYTPGSQDLEGLIQKYMATPGGLQTGLALKAALKKDDTPIKGAPGEVFFDPVTKRPLFSVPSKPENKPSALQEYEFAVGQGYKGTFTEWDKQRKKAGASNVTVAQGGVPHQVLKQQDEIIDRLTTARSIDADLGGLEQRIASGKLEFGPVSNLLSQGRNIAGLSNEQSRNFATFKSTLEKLRNDSLRLNAGVQTEGDAQRAWNELFQSVNDKDLVKQRLAEIRKINQRAAKLQEYRLEVLRGNFAATPLPTAPVEPAIDARSGVKRTGTFNGRKVIEYEDGRVEYAD